MQDLRKRLLFAIKEGLRMKLVPGKLHGKSDEKRFKLCIKKH